MSQHPLDDYRDTDTAESEARARRRRVILLACVGIVAGIVIGYFIATNWLIQPAPQFLELAPSAQDDYILMVAEAYAVDRNIPLAQQRLTRLNDPHTTDRIIALAKSYAPQKDYVAVRLALLAVAAGAKDPELVALASTLTAPTRVPTFTPRNAPPELTDTPYPTDTQLPSYVVVTGIPTNTLPPNYVVVTGVPTATPTPRRGTWTATPIVETDDERPTIIEPMPPQYTAQKIPINIPAYANFSSAEIRLAARPKQCTPADKMPPMVTATLLLCAGQTYAPIRLVGNNLTLYGDADKTAVVQGAPRQFAITVEGANNSLVSVHVQGATQDADLNQWLCLYPHCWHTPEIGGAVGYGGGVLLKNTVNAAVVDSQFNGGTTGILSERGYSNKLFNNSFSDHNGWGILLMQTRDEYVVHNQFDRINRACNGLDNVYHANGCESSALEMTQVQRALVYDNTCRRASDCYYANGDAGYASMQIKFYNNQCAGALNNCFEVTFGFGHEFDYNSATHDDVYGDDCDYPVWIGGSTAYFGPNNTWQCVHNFDSALNDSRTKTDRPTNALALMEPATFTPTLTPTRKFQTGIHSAAGIKTPSK